MKTGYREIKINAGCNIESAMQELNKHKVEHVKVCCKFNGKYLYSDIDDIESAYLKITGKTKAQFDADEKKWHDEYEENERKHKEAIPELTKEWTKKGNAIIDKKYHKLWAECVPIRLNDLYRGMELGACLEIVTELNKGCELETAKEIIEKQGHSGMTLGLVCSMVKDFCDRGTEFFNYVKS